MNLIDRIFAKQCHKPPIWEWFIPPIYGEIGGWFIVVLPTLWVIRIPSKLGGLNMYKSLVRHQSTRLCLMVEITWLTVL